MPSSPSTLSRREFLRRAAIAATSAPVAGALLAACTEPSAPTPGPSAPVLSSPIGPDFQSGRPIERGAVLRVYEWKEYLAKEVLEGFEQRYRDQDVRVEVQSFLHIDEAVARLQDASNEYDVFFPTIDVLGGLVSQGLLRPLDHDQIPNLRNLWSWFRTSGAPFYDPGQRYTVPYTVFSSGIGWRQDLVDPNDAPDRLADPYGIFWNERYRGRLGLYDDYLEALSLAMQRDGVVDLRAATEEQLSTAADSLADAVRRTQIEFTDDGAWDGLPEGEFAAHQSWSGDALTARRYAMQDGSPEVVPELRYWSPPGPAKVVGCDLMAICARGRHPDLAHAFINHLLDTEVGLRNFAWNGYQPPLEELTREAFGGGSGVRYSDVVPANLRDAVLTPAEFAAGQMLVGFGPSERARWLDQWKRVETAG